MFEERWRRLARRTRTQKRQRLLHGEKASCPHYKSHSTCLPVRVQGQCTSYQEPAYPSCPIAGVAASQQPRMSHHPSALCSPPLSVNTSERWGKKLFAKRDSTNNSASSLQFSQREEPEATITTRQVQHYRSVSVSSPNRSITLARSWASNSLRSHPEIDESRIMCVAFVRTQCFIQKKKPILSVNKFMV